jgi:hypothetical protein
MEQFEVRVDARFSKLDEGLNDLKQSVNRDVEQMRGRHNRLLAGFVELRTHVLIMNKLSGSGPIQLMELTDKEEGK